MPDNSKNTYFGEKQMADGKILQMVKTSSTSCANMLEKQGK